MLSEDELDFVQTVIDRDDLENIDLNNNNFADPAFDRRWARGDFGRLQNYITNYEAAVAAENTL